MTEKEKEKVRMQVEFENTFPFYKSYLSQLRSEEILLSGQMANGTSDEEVYIRWHKLQQELAGITAKILDFEHRNGIVYGEKEETNLYDI